MVGLLLTALLLHSLRQLPCQSPDEASFSLSYNGGRIMTEPVAVSLLWFGTGWQESGREAIRNAIASLTASRYPIEDSEVPTLGNWWDIIRQYKDGSGIPVTGRVDVGAECFYTGPQHNMTQDQVLGIGRAVFNETAIDGFGGNLNCTRVFEVSDRSIYHIVFSHTVMFLDGREQRELMNWCSGELQVEVSASNMVKMAWARAPQNIIDQCSMFFHGKSYLGPPNGDEKIDSLVRHMLANIAEEVTNGDGKGWISNDGSGMTVSSTCASMFEGEEEGPPLFMNAEKTLAFNAVGVNGYRYMVPYIWDQKIRNCALKPSELCGSDALMLRQSKGHLNGGVVVNHTNGLQPYAPNQKCQWKIEFSSAKFISFTFNYLLVAAGSDDHVMICPSDSKPTRCSVFQTDDEQSLKDLRIVGSKAYIEFLSGEQVSSESRGWELRYSAGPCNGKEDVYDRKGVIGYTSSTGFSYIGGLGCQWVLHGKPGTLVSLNFTQIDISKDLDYLAIYDSLMQQIANFSGFYSGSSLPQMNFMGEVMVAFDIQTDGGAGWSADFYIASPADRNKRTLLIIVVIVLVVVGIGFLLALVRLGLLRKRKQTNRVESNENLIVVRVEINGHQNQIGEGPSAIIYRADLADGSSVAVKSPREVTSQTELEEEILLKSSSHPNIISLIGYAEDGVQRRYLVFEFMGMGSLNWNLRERGETLQWEKRLTIALQISSAIQMLHIYLQPPVYHGNIKSENILLDEFYNVKLGGFGTANYCKNDRINLEKPSEMAEDIWSFGLLLAELLRGEPLLNRHASEFFRSLKDFNELVGGQEYLDPRLDIPKEECKIMGLAKLGEIAKWCIGGSHEVAREQATPTIGDVVLGLNQVKQLFFSVPSQVGREGKMVQSSASTDHKY